ncbi:MAG: hypothetical protein F4Z16_06575 [Rhodothermaceae bacterium]|nr:hypothetical protein [Rhodothermaceae bacterium]MYD66851.1 hypothetical protein [Rhodothermaceae bacterium]MYI78153.1 hypothetical protein [Gammaproteobacteria bacterium]
MRTNIVLRMIDLTLLLLLSLLAAVRISEYEVELPVSHELADKGALTVPIQVVVSVQGELFVEGLGKIGARELAEFSATEQRAVELRVDGSADAFHLLQIHQTLEQAAIPAVFIVEHRTR